MLPLVAIPSSSENSTTPRPSLNSDSPVITTSRFFGAPADRKIPITATGSVGEISAPNNRQYGNDSATPSSGSTHHSVKPTTSVEAMVPITASAPICQR